MAEADPIRVAVVGHANAGKTSLIRTLLRSTSFGEISDSAGTTRHVERAALLVGNDKVLELYDTPGLEDPLALQDALERNKGGAEQLQGFLDSTDRYPELEQEAKVLRQSLRSDILLYVVDVRLAVREKFCVELDILSSCGKPIIPVFNFIVDQEPGLQAWRAQMVERNLHAALEFDTVAFNFEAEKRLYQKMQSVLEPRYQQLQSLIDSRNAEWQDLCEAAVRRSTQLLAETACLRLGIEQGADKAAEQLQKTVREMESACLRDLLRLFSFSKEDIKLAQIPVNNGEWEFDLFSLATLKMFGLDARSSALKGAAAGAGLDLMVGGLSLGMATTLGALLGAGYSTAKRYGSDIAAALRNEDYICLDRISMDLILLRQLDLLRRLTQRGHAAQQQSQASLPAVQELPKGWADILADLKTGQISQGDSNQRFHKARQQLQLLLAKNIA